MVKLIHHETPVNKALHHRKIEILAVLTLFVGSLSFLIYSFCTHNADNPLCRCLLCSLNRMPEDGELNLILWSNYMVLLFCYDDNFIGDRYPITALAVFGCLTGSFVYVPQTDPYQPMGLCHSFCHCHCSCVPDFCGSDGKMECFS